jgi:hypothetical protein
MRGYIKEKKEEERKISVEENVSSGGGKQI